MRLIEKAFLAELFLELLERELQRADPDRLHMLDDDLIITTRLIDADTAPDNHLQAILGPELQIAVAVPEARSLHLGALVLEREVHVAGGVVFEVRDLALKPEFAELVLQGSLDLRGNL